MPDPGSPGLSFGRRLRQAGATTGAAGLAADGAKDAAGVSTVSQEQVQAVSQAVSQAAAGDAAGQSGAQAQAGGAATAAAGTTPTAAGKTAGAMASTGASSIQQQQQQQAAVTETTAPAARPAYVTVCAAVKDQHADVREWLAYHRAIGVDRFYLVDTGSASSMASEVADYIGAGVVDFTYNASLVPTPGTHGPQLAAYEICLAKARSRAEVWMAAIDLDEFLVIRDGTADLPTLLRDYEPYGGLAVNWVVFGGSGVKTKPKTNTLSSYWACAPQGHSENLHIKSIVQPARTAGVTTDPHHFRYEPPHFAVSTRREAVQGPKSQEQASERLALYHYAVKSEQEFAAKIKRGSGMGNQKTIDYLYYVNNYTTSECYDGVDRGMQFATFASPPYPF